MLNKTTSLFLLICLFATTNLFVLGQTQSYKAGNSQQSNTLSKKEFLNKLGVNSTERADELLNNTSFFKVKKDSITEKTMQDADKAQQQQKKKFVGMNTTTAIVIGAAIAAAIIIVLATKNKKRKKEFLILDAMFRPTVIFSLRINVFDKIRGLGCEVRWF